MALSASHSKAVSKIAAYYKKHPTKKPHPGIGAIAEFWMKHPSNKKVRRPSGS
jgi:hypothetical protein